MPGTLVIDAPRSFSSVFFMGSQPRLEFGTERQEISATGEKKWTVDCAVTYIPVPGMRPQSDVLTVTVTGPASDPGLAIPPGSQVELEQLRVGVSAPEKRDNGRIAGGRAYFMASGIRSVNGRGSSPAPKGE